MGEEIVDEAHHFRNPGTKGEDPTTPASHYWALSNICEGKDVYLLTATPVNNRLLDLQHMIELFRAVLLKDEAVAPLLPEKLREQAGAGVGFQPLLAILRNPGLRPYLDPGVQRSYSYDFVESFADNWWCADWKPGFGHGGESLAPEPVAFLSTDARTAGRQETQKLLSMGSADEYLGRQVVEYARAHPDDKQAPEALYLTLRMMRYGCYHGYGAEKPGAHRVTDIAHQVVVLMRRRYSSDPWIKKAAPFVWLGEKREN